MSEVPLERCVFRTWQRAHHSRECAHRTFTGLFVISCTWLSSGACSGYVYTKRCVSRTCRACPTHTSSCLTHTQLCPGHPAACPEFLRMCPAHARVYALDVPVFPRDVPGVHIAFQCSHGTCQVCPIRQRPHGTCRVCLKRFSIPTGVSSL